MNETRRGIERLSGGVASRIAAGEVIERPASAAKELLENAIDAGASDIVINLEEGGKASLVMEDNGCGIPFRELPLAMERYATSKIRTLEDLERVGTLGYRGEALSSIAAVSRVELRSRTPNSDLGGMICSEGGTITAHVEIPAAPGTRVQIRDLFYNLPARRKFLRGSTAELRRIIGVVQDYALAYPKIRFRVSNDGKKILDIGDVGSTDEVLSSLWGAECRIHASVASQNRISVSMWWNNLPGSRRVAVTLFVNNRRVQDPTVRAALNSTGASIFGEWIVMVFLPPEDVDVNIHPAKAEIRFRKTGPVFELVRQAARELLLAGGGFLPDEASSLPGIESTKLTPPWREDFRAPEISGEDGSLFSRCPPVASPLNDAKSRSENFLFHEETISALRRYLGQVQGGYLVFDEPRGMCLLDAHAAHERILYEEIEDSFAGEKIPQQRLAFEQEIPSALVAAVTMNRDVLSGMGFSFELPDDEPGSLRPALLTAVPSIRGLGRLSPVEMLRSALRGVEEEGDPSKRDREVWWRWARTACRDAIKLGESLEPEEALSLFERLERCRSPYSCPHGRPTTIFLAGEKLRNWFER